MAKPGKLAQNVIPHDLATWLQWAPLNRAMAALPVPSGLLSMKP